SRRALTGVPPRWASVSFPPSSRAGRLRPPLACRAFYRTIQLPVPDQTDGLASHTQGLHRRHRQVLLRHNELSPHVEVDDVPGGGAEVDDLPDVAGHRALARPWRLIRFGYPDLLGPDGERTLGTGDGMGRLTRQDIRDVDESGHARRLGALLDLGG